jgi:hypothetical protein
VRYFVSLGCSDLVIEGVKAGGEVRILTALDQPPTP